MSKSVPAWTGIQIATIPAGYRPKTEVRTPLVTDQSVAALVVKPDGAVHVLARASKLGSDNAPTNIAVSSVYPIA